LYVIAVSFTLSKKNSTLSAMGFYITICLLVGRRENPSSIFDFLFPTMQIVKSHADVGFLTNKREPIFAMPCVFDNDANLNKQDTRPMRILKLAHAICIHYSLYLLGFSFYHRLVGFGFYA
jgi:hypothetical protein